MKYIKKYETNFSLDVEKIYLEDIYKKSKHRMLYSKLYRAKDHKIIIDILEKKLKGKIVSFTYKDDAGYIRFKKDKITDVAYDNDSGNEISYLKIKDDWYSIYKEAPIYIHHTESDVDKYNL